MKQNDTYRKKSGVANSGSNAGVMQLCYFFLNSKKYCNKRTEWVFRPRRDKNRTKASSQRTTLSPICLSALGTFQAPSWQLYTVIIGTVYFFYHVRFALIKNLFSVSHSNDFTEFFAQPSKFKLINTTWQMLHKTQHPKASLKFEYLA
jgi:hypothetical protein